MPQPQPPGAKEKLNGSVSVELAGGVEAAGTGKDVYLTTYGVWVYSEMGVTRTLFPWHTVESVTVS